MYKKPIAISGLMVMVMSAGCELTICNDGEIMCISSEAEGGLKCSVKECIDGDYRPTGQTCEFGFDMDKTDCVNPCQICGESGHGTCPEMIVDKTMNIAYHCYESGWTKDISCVNDYQIGGLIEPDVEKLSLYSKETISVSKNDQIYAGICGECSSDMSPEYYSIENGLCVLHQCENGTYRVKAAKDSSQCEEHDTIKKCTDSFKSGYDIYVDIANNRYHCGDCGYVCGTGQKCVDEKCQSDIVCKDGYTTIQLGSRWIKAKCIDDLNELDNDSQDYDNAYILMKDVDIDEAWTPIEVFNGYLFGNGKTLNINVGFKDGDVVGLFGNLQNAYISDLIINYRGKKEINAKYFGLLAGISENTVISNIIYSNEEKPIVVHDTIVAGGLIGKATNINLSDITFNIELSGENDCSSEGEEENKCQNEEEPGIGGLIGVAWDIDRISNVYPLNYQPMTISGVRNTGGLIGAIIQKNGEGMLFNDNAKKAFDVSVTGNLARIGGLFGFVNSPDSNANNRLVIDNINLNSVNLIYGGDKNAEGQEFKTNFVVSPGTYKPRHFGGYVGSSSAGSLADGRNRIQFSNIRVGTVYIDDTSKSECVFLSGSNTCSSRVGGFAGTVSHVLFDHVSIEKISVSENEGNSVNREFRSIMGGFAGKSIESNYQSCTIEDVDLLFNHTESSVGGFVASSENNQYMNCHIHHCLIDTSGKWLEKAGCLIGDSISGDSVQKCSVHDFVINGTLSLGGLIGRAANAKISESSVHQSSDHKLVGELNIGGMIGLSENIEINDSRSSVNDVLGLQGVGGFVGRTTQATIDRSWSEYHLISLDASKKCRNIRAGALKPDNIETCEYKNEVLYWFGGFAGNIRNSIIKNSHAEGELIMAPRTTGGFSGRAENSEISDSFAIYDSISFKEHDEIKVTNYLYGGFIGVAVGVKINHCYTMGNRIHWDGVLKLDYSVNTSYPRMAGGLIGELTSDSRIDNTFAITKNIDVGSQIGGLIAYSEKTNTVLNNVASYFKANPNHGGSRHYIGGVTSNVMSSSLFVNNYISSVMMVFNANYKNHDVGGYMGRVRSASSVVPGENNYSYFRYYKANPDDGDAINSAEDMNVSWLTGLYDTDGNLKSIHDFFGPCKTCRCTFGNDFIEFDKTTENEQFDSINDIVYKYDKDVSKCVNQQTAETIDCVDIDTCHDKWHYIKCSMPELQKTLGCESECEDLAMDLCHSNEGCDDFILPLGETEDEVNCVEINASNTDGNSKYQIKCPTGAKAMCVDDSHPGDLITECVKNTEDKAIPLCGEGKQAKCVLMPPFCGLD